MQEEIWKEIKYISGMEDYLGYRVSNFGRMQSKSNKQNNHIDNLFWANK